MADCPYPIQNDPTKLKPEMQKALSLFHDKFQFKTVECLRTAERQAWMLANGKSKVAHSAHQDGRACDIFPLPNGYSTNASILMEMHELWAECCKAVGHEAHPAISWDMCHIQLDL